MARIIYRDALHTETPRRSGSLRICQHLKTLRYLSAVAPCGEVYLFKHYTFWSLPDIWIQDEPTSSLDREAEAAIFAELKEI